MESKFNLKHLKNMSTVYGRKNYMIISRILSVSSVFFFSLKSVDCMCESMCASRTELYCMCLGIYTCIQLYIKYT